MQFTELHQLYTDFRLSSSNIFGVSLQFSDVDSNVSTPSNATSLFTGAKYSQSDTASSSSSSSNGQYWDTVLLAAVSSSIPSDAAPPATETVQFKRTYHTHTSGPIKQQQHAAITATTDTKGKGQDRVNFTASTSTGTGASAALLDPVQEFLSNLPDLSYLLRRTGEIC